MLRQRRLVASMLAGIVLLFCLPMGAYAVGNTYEGKVINVIYDDSGSMVNSNGYIPRWSQAKYAMEVFSAMMGENDVMHIYPMSKEGTLGLTVYGNEASRVQAVHDMNAYYNNTPFKTVTSAANDLRNEGAEYDKWLVIITDGLFDDGATPQSTVQSTLDGYNAEGIKTIYLGIGDAAAVLEGNADGGYTFAASDGVDVLTKVTSIANQIFDHQVLPQANVITNDGDNLLNIDIPTDQIIVFAQGEEVSIGNLSLNGRDIQPSETQNVKYSDVLPLNYQSAPVDTSLKGVVVTFDAGSTPFESGQFSVQISGATTVEYYYKPGVTVNCGLLYDGQEIQSDDTLYAGEYEVALSFINPITGYVIDSELLSSANFTLTVINNGTEQTVESKSGMIELAEGDVQITAVAALPGNVSMSNYTEYVVFPEPIQLKLRTDSGTNSYSPDKLGDNATPIVLTIENETGNVISEEEWNSIDITVEESGGISWVVKKGAQAGTWELRPASADGTLTGVDPGDYELAVSAAYQIGNQYAYGAGTVALTIEPYAGNALQIKIANPAGAYDLNDMYEDIDSTPGMLVTVQYENPQTGEFTSLTEEMWNSFAIRAESDKNVSWSIEKGTETGTWVLCPGCYLGDVLATANGQVEVVVEAEGNLDAYHFSGTGTQKTEFVKLSWLNLAKILGPRILAGLAILWLIIGYIKKKRLKTRGLNPRCRFKDSTSPKQKISKNFFSVILPYVPEKAVVRCHKSAFQCNFPDLMIQATGNRSFKILNKSIPLKTTKICGEFYEDMDTLRKRKFSFGSFDISSVNPKTGNKTLGTFTFN